MNERKKSFLKKNKHFMVPFYGCGLTASMLRSHFEEAVYLGAIYQSTLEPPSGFDRETPGLGTKRLNH